MNREQGLQSEIGGYISTLMRKHFGKGPTSVYVTLQSAFFTIHLRGFLAPMERVLLKQGEHQRVIKTRDLLMQDLNIEIAEEIKKMVGRDVDEFYADWYLDKESGLLFGTLKEPIQEESAVWPKEVNKQEFIKKIEEASNNVEKVPGATEVFWLGDRTVLIKRSKILVEIEKELIRNNFEEELRISKRQLERKAFTAIELDKVLKRQILDTFFDWNFETDTGYMVFLLEPTK